MSKFSSKVLSQNDLRLFLDKSKWLENLLKDYKLPPSISKKDSHLNPKVILYGSAVNGTSLSVGDADYSVLFPANADNSSASFNKLLAIQKEKQDMVLSDIHKHLKEHVNGLETLKTQRIFKARVPIVSCREVQGDKEFKFDLSLSMDGVRNSYLLRKYTKSNPRLRLGILTVKQWGRTVKILDARKGWISPYALSIMYIYYQTVTGRLDSFLDETKVDKELLNLFNEKGDISDEYFDFYPLDETDVSIVRDDVYKFFEFFGNEENFDFDSSIVDIRTVDRFKEKDEWLKKLEHLDEGQKWHLLGHEVLFIRDPFEDHNLGKSVNFFHGEAIRDVFRNAARKKDALQFLEA